MCHLGSDGGTRPGCWADSTADFRACAVLPLFPAPQQADGTSVFALPKVEGKKSKFGSIDELVAYHVENKGGLPCKLILSSRRGSAEGAGGTAKAGAAKTKGAGGGGKVTEAAWYVPSLTRAKAETSLSNKVRTCARSSSWVVSESVCAG